MPERLLVSLFCMVLAGCMAGPGARPEDHSKDPQAVMGETWQWEGTITPVETIAAQHPERYSIRLLENGRVEARFDCNRGGGGYEISPGKLTFGPLISTRMACPPDSQDGLFMRDLQRVVSFFLQNGNLYLELPFDSGSMRFRRAPR